MLTPQELLVQFLTDAEDRLQYLADDVEYRLPTSHEYATAVFTMRATTAWGQPYENDYSMTIRCKDGKIVQVYELLDTKRVFDTLDLTSVTSSVT